MHLYIPRYMPDNFPDSTTASGERIPGEWRRAVEGDVNLQTSLTLTRPRASRAAHMTRDDYTHFFETPQGLVPWQLNVVRQGLLNVPNPNP